MIIKTETADGDIVGINPDHIIRIRPCGLNDRGSGRCRLDLIDSNIEIYKYTPEEMIDYINSEIEKANTEILAVPG